MSWCPLDLSWANSSSFHTRSSSWTMPASFSALALPLRCASLAHSSPSFQRMSASLFIKLTYSFSFGGKDLTKRQPGEKENTLDWFQTDLGWKGNFKQLSMPELAKIQTNDSKCIILCKDKSKPCALLPR